MLLSDPTYINSFEDYYESLASSIAESTATVVNKAAGGGGGGGSGKDVPACLWEQAGALVPERELICPEGTGGLLMRNLTTSQQTPEYQELLQLFTGALPGRWRSVVSLYLGYLLNWIPCGICPLWIPVRGRAACRETMTMWRRGVQVEQLRAGNYATCPPTSPIIRTMAGCVRPAPPLKNGKTERSTASPLFS